MIDEIFPPGAGALPFALPAGRVVRAETEDGPPVLWASHEPVPLALWAEAAAAHPRTGLWPLLLKKDAIEAWDGGELYVEEGDPPGDPAEVLAGWWNGNVEIHDDDRLSVAEREAVTAPYGQRWPGLAPELAFQGEPAAFARGYATHLHDEDPSLQLGLVAAPRGADALSVMGWAGPANHAETSAIAAVVRSWEDRFGAWVVALGFDELYLSVAAPPTTPEEARRVAAEHFAFCPDNIWQSQQPYTLEAYADRIAGLNGWYFWWD